MVPTESRVPESPLDPIVAEFVHAWIAHLNDPSATRPDLLHFLEGKPADERLRVLPELIGIDIDYCYRADANLTLLAEDYFKRFDQLPRERLIELVVEHFGRVKAKITADEYCRQFPEFEAELRQRIGGMPRVPGYEIVRELGRGGMGVVYYAKQVNVNRFVALKLVQTSNDAAMRRFRTESEAVARLQHPNVVQVFEVGEHEGQPFFSMEYADGGSLNERIAGEWSTPRDAAVLVEKLARAMQQAHERGVIHRDLKPLNILLAKDGTPKIADFGLAKQLDDQSGETKTGAVLGTPSYMAPEQAAGQTKPGPAVDVYGLGAIFYACLTGQAPFRGPNVAETLRRVIEDEPVSPRKDQPQIARDLETICLKCLHKDPTRRYHSALELADDLRRHLNNVPILARPTPWHESAWKWSKRHRGWSAIIALGFLLVVVGSVLGYSVWDKNGQLAVANNSLGSANTQLKETNGDLEDKRTQLEVTNGELTKNQTNLKKEKAATVRQLVLLRANSGAERMNEGNPVIALPFLVDALRIMDENKLNDVALEQQLRQQLAAIVNQCPRPVLAWAQDTSVFHAEFSADGGRILTAGRDAARVWDAKTGQPIGKPMRGGTSPLASAAINNDGGIVITGGYDGMARVWDARTGDPVGSPLRVSVPVLHVEFSPNGKYFLAAGGNRFATASVGPNPREPDGITMVWELPAGDKKEFKEVGFGIATGWTNHAAFSPASDKFATASGSHGQSQTARVWDIPAAKGKLRKMLDQPHHGQRVAFAPDGKRIVVASGGPPPLRSEAIVWDIDSSEKVGASLKHENTVTQVEFSHNGKFIVTGSDDNTARIWDAQEVRRFIDPKGGTMEFLPVSPPLVHRDVVTVATFSPDDRLLLTASRDGVVRFWHGVAGDAPRVLHQSIKAGGPALHALPHGSAVLSAHFSADGKRFVTACENGLVRVWDLASIRERTQVFDHPSLVTFATFLADGRIVTVNGHPVHRTTFGGTSASSSVIIQNDRVWLWDPAKPDKPIDSRPHNRAMQAQFVSPNGQRIITLAGEPRPNIPLQMAVWQPAANKVDSLDKQGTGQLIWAGFIADGTCVLARQTTEGKAPNAKWHVSLFNGETGQRIAGPFTHTFPVRHLDISRDGKTMAIVAATPPDPFGRAKSPRAVLHLWDVATGKSVGLREDLGDAPVDLTVASAARVVALVRPNRVELVKLESEKPLVLRHAGAITSVTFSSDDRFAVTSSADRSARIWNVETGEAIGPPLEHRAQVAFAAVSPCNRYVATCGNDNTARVWSASTGEPITPWLPHPGEVVHASFSADSKRLVTANHAGTACIWEVIAENSRPIAELVRLAELFSASRLQAQGGLRPLGPAEFVKTWQSAGNK